MALYYGVVEEVGGGYYLRVFAAGIVGDEFLAILFGLLLFIPSRPGEIEIIVYFVGLFVLRELLYDALKSGNRVLFVVELFLVYYTCLIERFGEYLFGCGYLFVGAGYLAHIVFA